MKSISVLLLLFAPALFGSRCDDSPPPPDGDSDTSATGADTSSSETEDSDSGTASLPAQKFVTPAQLSAALDGGGELLLLNVADVEFYELGCIGESLLIPWDQLPDRLAEVPADADILIYCRRGVRSESAFTTLQEGGYSSLWILDGGIEAWTAAGLPTTPCQ
jgi:rhodanese-related sulfurtransferase